MINVVPTFHLDVLVSIPFLIATIVPSFNVHCFFLMWGSFV